MFETLKIFPEKLIVFYSAFFSRFNMSDPRSEIVKQVINTYTFILLLTQFFQGNLALKALQKFEEKNSKNLLFPEEDRSLFLLFKFKKMSLARQAFRRRLITLPNTDKSASNTSICLILPDFDRSKHATRDPDVDRQAREWADKLEKKYGITGKDVAKVLTIFSNFCLYIERCLDLHND